MGGRESPPPLCCHVPWLLSRSMGAVLVQHSRRTKWDWFMAGPSFVWSRSRRLMPYFSQPASCGGPQLPHCCRNWRTPPHRVSPEPEGLMNLLPGGSELCNPVLGTRLRLCLQPLLRAGSSEGAPRAIPMQHLCVGVRTLLLLQGEGGGAEVLVAGVCLLERNLQPCRLPAVFSPQPHVSAV